MRLHSSSGTRLKSSRSGRSGNSSGGLPFSVAFNSRGGVAERKLGQLKPDDLAQWAGAIA